jgi:hypothetical protein
MALFVGVPRDGTRVVVIAGVYPAELSVAKKRAAQDIGEFAQLTESVAGHDRQPALTWQSLGG